MAVLPSCLQVSLIALLDVERAPDKRHLLLKVSYEDQVFPTVINDPQSGVEGSFTFRIKQWIGYLVFRLHTVCNENPNDTVIVGSRRVDLSKLAADTAASDGAAPQQQWIALKRESTQVLSSESHADGPSATARKPLGVLNQNIQACISSYVGTRVTCEEVGTEKENKRSDAKPESTDSASKSDNDSSQADKENLLVPQNVSKMQSKTKGEPPSASMRSRPASANTQVALASANSKAGLSSANAKGGLVLASAKIGLMLASAKGGRPASASANGKLASASAKGGPASASANHKLASASAKDNCCGRVLVTLTPTSPRSASAQQRKGAPRTRMASIAKIFAPSELPSIDAPGSLLHMRRTSTPNPSLMRGHSPHIVEEMTKQIQSLQKQVRKSESNFRSSESNVRSLTQSYNNALGNLKKQRENIDQLKATIKSQDRKLKALDQHLSHMNETLQMEQELREQARDELQKEKKAFEEHRLQQDDHYRNMVSQMRSEHSIQVRELEQKLKIEQQHMDVVKAEKRTFATRLREAQREVQKLTDEITKLRLDLELDENLRQPWHHASDFSSCERCDAKFCWYWRWKHHCRRCGHVICSKCSSLGFARNYTDLVRVCREFCPKLQSAPHQPEPEETSWSNHYSGGKKRTPSSREITRDDGSSSNRIVRDADEPTSLLPKKPTSKLWPRRFTPQRFWANRAGRGNFLKFAKPEEKPSGQIGTNPAPQGRKKQKQRSKKPQGSYFHISDSESSFIDSPIQGRRGRRHSGMLYGSIL